MKRTIALGTALLVAINVLAGAAYSVVWPYLYDLGLISWDWDWRLLAEITVYALIIATLGWFFCSWFARRIENNIKDQSQI